MVGGRAGTVAARQAVPVTDVKLGRQVGADMRVTDETDDFDASDMINAAVPTSGNSPNTMRTARWTFEDAQVEDGQVVDSTTQTIAPTGDAATVVHIMKPGGFPTGKYKLQVMLNGAEVKVKV